MKSMKTALTVAGSDCSGGAGIQADIKTMTLHGVYAMSAVTALTAQNTTGVFAVCATEPAMLRRQLDAVFTDIRPDAVKVGMLHTEALVRVTAQRLRFYRAENIVVDPVMVSTSGTALMQPEAVRALTQTLFPLATLITPNIPEAQTLLGRRIDSREAMCDAAATLYARFGCAVLLKGGHRTADADDCFFDGQVHLLHGTRIDNPNTHGTGCTLSAAVAANLAQGFSLPQAVARAKAYVTETLRAMLDLGHGNGPVCHTADLHGRFCATP